MPRASISRAPAVDARLRPISAIFSPRILTSASIRPSAVTIRPLRMIISVCCSAWAQQQTEMIIRNGLIVTAEGRMEADVRIRGEKIAEIGRNLASTAGAREIDARGMLLLPGAVDTH